LFGKERTRKVGVAKEKFFYFSKGREGRKKGSNLRGRGWGFTPRRGKG